MRKNLAALYIKMTAIQKIQKHHLTKKKAPLINYVIGNQKSLRRKKSSITRELKLVIKHYDARRGVCVTNLNAKMKRSLGKNNRGIKIKFGLETIQIYEQNNYCMNKSDKLQQLYIHIYKLFLQSKFTYL